MEDPRRDPAPRATDYPRKIPRTVVHVFRRGDLPPPLAENHRRMAADNPSWRFELFDEDRILAYIRDHFGQSVLQAYLSILPEYGAARTDLFRYMRIYQDGGVYLDVKSSVTRPLDDIVLPGDEYVLCQWANRPGEAKEGLGLHKDLGHVAGGEYQQWHVIGRAQHPYLARVIEHVLANIRHYAPWRLGVGAPGVLRTTGPIAYTQAITPIIDDHPHRLVRDETTIGLLYSIGGGYVHRQHFPNHYSTLTSGIVPLSGMKKVSAALYGAAVRAKRRWRRAAS